MTWYTVKGPAPTNTDTPTEDDLKPRMEWGTGGTEWSPDRGIQRTAGGEFSAAPIADPNTGYIFKTEAGAPVPATGARMHDLVVIEGMPVKVAVAVRLGLIPDPSRGAVQAPQAAHNAPQQVIQQATQEATPEAAEGLAEAFTNEVMPSLSRQVQDMLVNDLSQGIFSERTTDNLQLETSLPLSELSNIRDAYAEKVTTATGMSEAELEVLFKGNPNGFAQAARDMLKTGSTAAFERLADADYASSFTPLSTDDALTAWQDAEFPRALIEAGIEPVFGGDELSIVIPGKGTVTWTEAVRRGYVKVSRA